MGRIIVQTNVRGYPAVQAAYRDFKDQYINRLVKTGAGKAGRKTVPGVKSATKPGHRTGILESSRGMKQKSYRRSKVWVVLVGARHGFGGTLPFWGKVDPTKYDHLFEGGRNRVRAGTRTVRKPASIGGRRVMVNVRQKTNAKVLAMKMKIPPKAKRKGRVNKKHIQRQIRKRTGIKRLYVRGARKVLGGYIVYAKVAKAVAGRKPVERNMTNFATNAQTCITSEIRTGIPKILAKYGNKVYK